MSATSLASKVIEEAQYAKVTMCQTSKSSEIFREYIIRTGDSKINITYKIIDLTAHRIFIILLHLFLLLTRSI